jgi:hypothetical protein
MLQGGSIFSGIRRTGTLSGRPAINADVDEPTACEESNIFKNVFTGGLLSKRIGRPAFAEVGTVKPPHMYSFIPRDLKERVRNIKGLFGRGVDSSASNSRALSSGDSSNAWIGHQNFRYSKQRVGDISCVEPQRCTHEHQIVMNSHLVHSRLGIQWLSMTLLGVILHIARVVYSSISKITSRPLTLPCRWTSLVHPPWLSLHADRTPCSLSK